MPDWLAPFHLPKFTNDQFEEARRKYTQQYGYTITMPGLGDIIKTPWVPPMTAQEKILWKNKQWHGFTYARLADLRAWKQRKKNWYLASLASPSPRTARGAGAILTALDDTQDALATIAVIGKMALKMAPRILGKVFAGPLSWLYTTAEVMQLPQTLMCNLINPKEGKRMGDTLSESNPFGKKGKVKRSQWLRRVTPTKGDWIQGLQTSNEIWGLGISLGPIVGFFQDIVFGTALFMEGKPVTIETPVHRLTRKLKDAWRATETGKSWAEFEKEPDYSLLRGLWTTAQKAAKAASVLWSVPTEITNKELLNISSSAYLSAQALLPFQGIWNPLTDIPDPDDIAVHAPVPRDLLSIEVINEAGIPYEEVAGWPQTGTRYASLNDLIDQGEPMIKANRDKFQQNHKHDWDGWAFNQLTTDTAFNIIAGIEGQEQVKYAYSAVMTALLIFLENGYAPDLNQPPHKILILVAYIDFLDRTSRSPTLRDLLKFCQDNDIKLVQTTG